MKLFVILALVGVAVAAPNSFLIRESSLPSYASSELRSLNFVPIVRYTMDNDHRGSFDLETITADGSTFVKHGQLRDLGHPEGPATVMSGSYSFVEDGKTYTVHYTADENGYRATGDHLPTPPPLPAHLAFAF